MKTLILLLLLLSHIIGSEYMEGDILFLGKSDNLGEKMFARAMGSRYSRVMIYHKNKFYEYSSEFMGGKAELTHYDDDVIEHIMYDYKKVDLYRPYADDYQRYQLSLYIDETINRYKNIKDYDWTFDLKDNSRIYNMELITIPYERLDMNFLNSEYDSFVLERALNGSKFVIKHIIYN